ncbi:MAG: energy transducer TonB [Ignavibacteria bacterium]|nr:energy transducer TonB [Ignavibacteria bacterium]
MKTLALLSLIFSMNAFSQSDKPQSNPNSLSYGDSVWSEIMAVCLNLVEVKKMIIYPNVDAEGRVVVKCFLDKDGNVEKTGKISGPEIFYEEIRRVAMFLKFSPATVNNYPVKIWVSVPFTFTLKSD